MLAVSGPRRTGHCEFVEDGLYHEGRHYCSCSLPTGSGRSRRPHQARPVHDHEPRQQARGGAGLRQALHQLGGYRPTCVLRDALTTLKSIMSLAIGGSQHPLHTALCCLKPARA